eukprot:SAG31_NODE_2856_length_4992_cov_2.079910_4_plen_77_part_00
MNKTRAAAATTSATALVHLGVAMRELLRTRTVKPSERGCEFVCVKSSVPFAYRRHAQITCSRKQTRATSTCLLRGS